MDFQALSRRELQALCKRNAIRANMTNAAMAEALRCLPSVDGIDQIGKTAPPVMSARKPAEDVVGEDQRHGCLLPSGVPARATRRRAAAHKMEDTAPAPDTLQMTQKTTAQAPGQPEQVSTTKRRTRRSRRSKAKIALEAAATAQNEPIADSLGAVVESAVGVSDKTSDELNEEKVITVVEEKASKPKEGILEHQEPISTVLKSASSVTIKNLPIQSIVEAAGRVIEMAQHSSVGDGEGFAEWSPAGEMTDESSPVTGDKSDAADVEALKEDGFTLSGESDQSNLLVNTLDRFVKPMYKFTVKKEKKNGECWWMLM